uniref:Death domain containing 1 n=1 Tax=Zonotrichia albicollis TaxID=44394 RepID=A0A8D2NI46_ZONAL
MKKEDGEHQLVIVSFTEKKECSGKLHGGSSVTEKPPDLAFQDALTSNEEDILSGTLKDIYDRNTMNSFQQKKKEEVRDNLKGLKSEDHKLTEKMEDTHTLSLFRNTGEKTLGNYFIKAPATVLENLKCNTLNDTSSLVVDDSKELVSNVISMECYDYEKPLFPINIAFTSCFRGNYQEIMVKVTDTNFHTNYVKGTESFAEVKIYHLGVFALLSCLKKETFTVPKVGLLQKLNVDFQISFCYHSETFNSLIQPIEPSVSALKARHYMYHSVISMSALVHIQHPSSQPFNSSVTITLPCPPNPDKKRQELRQKMQEPLVLQLRGLLQHTILKGWKVFDDVIIQNAQNGLVSFELNEHLESFMVVCLAFLLENRYLLLFAQVLEEALRSTRANVILYQKRENPYKVAVFSEGYIGPPEPTQHFPLRQGEQIHFRFRGNISASGKAVNSFYRLIFHSQRQPRLELQIKEGDEFSNHSSPHYKGTAVFYKITREMIPKKWMIPKKPYHMMNINTSLHSTKAPALKSFSKKKGKISSYFTNFCPSEALWDKLLFWLAQELAEDNTSLFALCLPVRWSMFQLVRLKCPDNLTHQMYELLCCCKKTLPKSADKQQILSQYLQKSGRSDLSEELH